MLTSMGTETLDALSEGPAAWERFLERHNTSLSFLSRGPKQEQTPETACPFPIDTTNSALGQLQLTTEQRQPDRTQSSGLSALVALPLFRTTGAEIDRTVVTICTIPLHRSLRARALKAARVQNCFRRIWSATM